MTNNFINFFFQERRPIHDLIFDDQRSKHIPVHILGKNMLKLQGCSTREYKNEMTIKHNIIINL